MRQRHRIGLALFFLAVIFQIHSVTLDGAAYYLTLAMMWICAAGGFVFFVGGEN